MNITENVILNVKILLNVIKGVGNFAAPLGSAICAKLIQITAQNVCVMNINSNKSK